MKNKLFQIFALSMAFMLASSLVSFKNKTPKTIKTEFTVYGCCGDCKERIENALDTKGVQFASWDKETQILSIVYKTKLLSEEKIHQIIASVGHDTDKVKAEDSVYNALPGCCQYRGGKKCAH
jgi:bacterioferritin-associated ferredoxin